MSRGGGLPAEALLDLRRRLDEDMRAYLDWLLGECAEDGVEVDSLIKPAALDLMAMRLSTPLQFAEHLNRAFDAGFRMGQKPSTADIVAATLAPDFDDLEPISFLDVLCWLRSHRRTLVRS